MRRTLRSNFFKVIGPLDASPLGSCLATFATNLCRKSTSDHAAMDLSNMRKKYKEDEDVSCLSWLRLELRSKSKRRPQNQCLCASWIGYNVWRSSCLRSCMKPGFGFFTLMSVRPSTSLISAHTQHVFVSFSVLRRTNLCLWIQSNSLEIGLIKPPNALKLENQMPCALPQPPSRYYRK